MIGTDLSSSAVKELKKLEKYLTLQLRKDATRAGWPKNIVARLRVLVGSTDIEVSYPAALEDAIGDLEYGTPISNPKPVFRKFAAQHSGVLQDSIAELSINTLFDKGVLP